MVDLLKLCTIVVDRLFRRIGLELWDLKWELVTDGNELIVVDTMDRDSMRITKPVEASGKTYRMHFNKQAVRDFYRLLHKE